MGRRVIGLSLLACAAGLLACPSRVSAQAALADDLILLSKAKHDQENAKAHRHLETPGQGESPFKLSPGALAPRLGAPIALTTPASALAVTARPAGEGNRPPKIAPPASTASPKAGVAPLYGTLEVALAGDDGPADGLTLDAAMDRLVHENHDLRVKFQEIPKAQADILSAGLRNNPLVFASADSVPYGSYSQQRPGENTYTITVIQGVDVNRKRLDRIRVAEAAKQVLEAQYQDAVRLEIDNLYTAYVNVLAARATVRLARTGAAGLDKLVAVTRKLAAGGVQAKAGVDRLLIQRVNAETALQTAELGLRQAKQDLAVQLNVPADRADGLEPRGSLHNPGVAFPCPDELVRAAVGTRPDLTAYRLGVQRAQAEVGLAKKERISDVFVLYTPYGFRNNQPTGGQNATSWGVSAMVSLPVFNRNQGNIARAEINVTQTQIELAGLERKAVAEVHKAVQDVALTQASLKRLEEQVLPSAGKIKDAVYGLYAAGQESLVAYLNAQRDYNEYVGQYLETLVRHRRNQLRLNTAVGQRVVP